MLSIAKPAFPEAIVYKVPAAAAAPTHCAMMYGIRSLAENLPPAHKPKETAGLK
ncbi:hypothetical protein D3C80_1664450 [compost metagenome]